MRVERAAQIGRNALAEPRDQGEANSRGASQCRDNGEQSQGRSIQRCGAVPCEAVVNELFQPLPNTELQAGGGQQCDRSTCGGEPVGPQIRQQQAKGDQATAGGERGHGVLIATPWLLRAAIKPAPISNHKL